MNYEEFQTRKSFSKDELLAFAHGNLFDDAPPEFGAQPTADAIKHVASRAGRRVISTAYDSHMSVDEWRSSDPTRQ